MNGQWSAGQRVIGQVGPMVVVGKGVASDGRLMADAMVGGSLWLKAKGDFSKNA